MISEPSKGIFKLKQSGGYEYVNFYVLPELKIAIDCGNIISTERIEQEIKSICNPEEISHLLLTHLHYDHAGGVDLFPNATIYASSTEIQTFKSDPGIAFYARENSFIKKTSLDKRELIALPEIIAGLKVIQTPGHTTGAVCFYWEEKGILFTGDTMTPEGQKYRQDFPNNSMFEYSKSIKKLESLNAKLILDGHSK